MRLTYSEPIVARIPLGRSVRTSFLHVRCVILLGEKRDERSSWVEGASFFLRFSLYQCTGELRASACGRASRTINIRIRSRGPRDAIYKVSTTGRTMHSTNTCHWGGTMSVDGLVSGDKSDTVAGASLPIVLGKCGCECQCYKH